MAANRMYGKYYDSAQIVGPTPRELLSSDARRAAASWSSQVPKNPEELETRLEVLAGRKSNGLPEIREVQCLAEDLGRTNPTRAFELFKAWYFNQGEFTPAQVPEDKELRARFETALDVCHRKNAGKDWFEREVALTPRSVFHKY